VFADGVVEGHTAYLDEPYADAESYAGDASYRGTPLWTPNQMAAAFTALDKAGFQIHVHSIGDAATTEVLDALEAARAANGVHDWRPGITHLQLVDPADYARFAQLGVTAVPDPYWFLMDDYYWYLQLPYLGQQRADDEYPMKSFFTAGALVASASDFPVTIPPDPITGIQTGVMRWAPGWGIPTSDVLWPEESVTVRRMIQSFTINGARADFTDRTTGSIAKGKSADLIVLSHNILKTDPRHIDAADVTLTVFRGETVYRAK
jgi:predicted amidohydrolase YtcJ